MNVNAVDGGNTMSGAVAVEMPKEDVSRPCFMNSGDKKIAAEINNEALKKVVDELQSQMDLMNVSLEFSTYGERNEKIAVVVVNKQTGEVIREIPAKEVQNLYAKMSELTGIIFNREV